MQLSRATAGLARGGVACVARLGAAAPPPRRLATAVVACRPAAAPRRLLRLQSTPAAASGQPPSDEEVKGERTSSEWHKQISVLWEGAGEPPEETKSSPLHQALWARKQLAVTLSVMTTVLLYGLVFRDSAFAAVYWTWCMFIAYLCRHPVPRLVVAVALQVASAAAVCFANYIIVFNAGLLAQIGLGMCKAIAWAVTEGGFRPSQQRLGQAQRWLPADAAATVHGLASWVLTLVAAAAVTAALSKAICKLNGVEDPFAALRDAITPNLDSKAEGGEP